MSALLGLTTAAPACFGVFAENSRFCLSLSVLVCLCQFREFLLQSVIAYWFLLFNSIYVWVRVKICDEWNLRNWRGFFPLCIFCLCFFFFFFFSSRLDVCWLNVSLLSIAVVKTSRWKATWGVERWFGLTLPHHNPSLRHTEAGTQAGTESETMEK